MSRNQKKANPLVVHFVVPLMVGLTLMAVTWWINRNEATKTPHPFESGGMFSNFDEGLLPQDVASVVLPYEDPTQGFLIRGNTGFLLERGSRKARGGTLRCYGLGDEEGKWEVTNHPTKANWFLLRLHMRGTETRISIRGCF